MGFVGTVIDETGLTSEAFAVQVSVLLSVVVYVYVMVAERLYVPSVIDTLCFHEMEAPVGIAVSVLPLPSVIVILSPDGSVEPLAAYVPVTLYVLIEAPGFTETDTSRLTTLTSTPFDVNVTFGPVTVDVVEELTDVPVYLV